MINLVDFLRFSWVWERNSRRILSQSGDRRRGAVEGAAGRGKRGALGFSVQALGAAGRLVIAPQRQDMRGAHAHSAQALGAAGLMCKAPRGLKVREQFEGFLTSFRLFCLGD